jgi:hypothetical protein
MERSAPSANGGSSPKAPLYAKPEPLDPERHARLGRKHATPSYGFIAGHILFPLQVREFQAAAVSYPIVFAGEPMTPVVVMGLQDGANLFVGKKGVFDSTAYVPSFVERYPFISVSAPDNPERRLVCVDRDADGWTEDGPKAPLFKDGEPTPTLLAYIELCRQYDVDQGQTDAFMALLRDLDLIEMKQALHTTTDADGKPETRAIADYFAVSEDKLAQLPAETFLQLRDNGALTQIYAHLTSLNGWQRLLARSQLAG